MKQYKIPHKPNAPTDADQRRWEHSALRRRMIQGVWENDLEREMLRHFSTDRFMAIGPPDLSSNVLEQITRQLSVLYSQPPTVTHEQNIAQLVGRDGLITQAGLWPMMQRTQQMTLALRECFVRIDAVETLVDAPLDRTGIQYRIVTPDFVYCESSEDAPDVPLLYQELRLRLDPETNEPKYIYDILDIRDPKNPVFCLHEVQPNGTIGADVTEKYTGEPRKQGDAYPYRTKDNRPYLPLEMYRAEKTGLLWNAFDGSQMCYGALSAATLMSWWVHLVRDCCFSQKYTSGLGIAGLDAVAGDTTARRRTISTDPSSILMFYQDPENTGQPLIGQFQPSADPLKTLEAIAQYEYRVSTAAGLSSSVLKQSGDPRSGYALSVSRDGQRESARTFASVFSLVDCRLIAKTAMLSNRFLGTNLPESGYRIQYAQLPKSAEEIKAEREDILAKLAAGLISPVQAMQIMYPGIDDDQARQMLLKIKRERAEYM